MLTVDSFAFVSKPSLCDALVTYLRDSKGVEAPPVERERAAALLGLIAPPAYAGPLTERLLDGGEAPWVRTFALRALVRLGVRLSPGALCALLDDPWARLACEGGDTQHCEAPSGESPPPVEVWGLFSFDGATPVARDRLASWAPEGRAALLVAARQTLGIVPDGDPIPGVFGWLLDHWATHDRAALDREPGGAGRNADVAIAYSAIGRDGERRAVEAWLRAYEKRERSADDAWQVASLPAFVRVVEPGHPVYRAAYEAFGLPDEAQRAYLGDAELWGRIERALRGRAGGRHGAAGAFMPRHVVALASRLPGGTRRLAHVLARHELDAPVAELVARAAWPGAGASLARWAATRARRGFDTATDAVLRQASARPRGGARSLLHAALANDAPWRRYAAVVGLDALGERGDAWAERLRALLDEAALRAHGAALGVHGRAASGGEEEEGAGDAFVALRAAAALARLGEKAALARLAHAAEHAPTVCLRAEALRWLGELAPEAHLARLEAALVDDAASYADYDTPAQEEAAYVLARLATPPAMTALVRGYLAAKSNPAWDALDAYLTRLVVDASGPPPEAFANSWRARVCVARLPVGESACTISTRTGSGLKIRGEMTSPMAHDDERAHLDALYREVGGVAALADDLLRYLPRHKTDSAPIARLEADADGVGERVAAIVPHLLFWLQDGNWPVSVAATRFLLGVGAPLLGPVRVVLTSSDDSWKYWVLERLVAFDRPLREGVDDLLGRIADAPTRGECDEGIDVRARELRGS